MTRDEAIQIIKKAGFDESFTKEIIDAFIKKEGEKKLEKNVTEFLTQQTPIIQYYKK